MSAMSEESPLPPASDPQDPRYYAPRRPAERTEPRLATVNERAFQRARDEKLPASPELSVKLENAVYESLRRHMEPEVVPEPIDYRGQSTRRTLIAVATGVGAALAVASVAAFLFVTFYPKEEAGHSFAATAQPAAVGDDKPALSQFRALVNAGSDGQTFTHEQSEQLLRQFVQWQQKTAAVGKR
jgi:hypothetical protein